MDAQLDFFGSRLIREADPRGDGRGDEKFRTYFTLVPPPATAQDTAHRAELIARRFGVRYTTAAGRLHVSLNTIWRANDEVQPALIEDALDAGGAVRRPAFDLAFDRVQTWAGRSRSKTGGRSIVPTVLVCSHGVREAQELFADIRREMHRRGMPGSDKSIMPHLTLWWSHIRVPELVLDRPCRWRVDRFWLVQTVRGQRQPDYVGEWTLGA